MSELTQGQVQWHCSEEDGGPDVGIAIGLGGNRQLWIGEILDRDGDGWWSLVMYEPEKRLIDMKDYNEVRELFEDVIAPLMRDRPSDRIAELEARVAKLYLDLEAAQCLMDSQYKAGVKLGWNLCATDDEAGYQRVTSGTEHIAALKRIQAARAALNPSARSE